MLLLHPDVTGERSPLKRSAEAALEEASGLASAIRIDLVDSLIVPVRQVRPGQYLGPGKIAELADRIRIDEIDLVIFDCSLSPIQQRNLERALGAKVIDRTALILEIFGDRASTREGELQVELAHLTYQKSRLVRSWTHLERQRGGMGFMGGPGETQIEADRRLIDERIAQIRRQLKSVTRTRGLHRARRQKAPYPVIALVGYTNAGKSTLFNRMTRADVMAKDMLFATLDPTLRAIDLPSGRRVMLSDTVGFVSELPTTLVAAFRATLEEVLEADIVVHVRDAAHGDSDIQRDDVLAVLADLGLEPAQDGQSLAHPERGRLPLIEALNKIDLADDETRTALAATARRHGHRVALSALTGEGCDDLVQTLDGLLSAQDVEMTVIVPFEDGATQAWLKAHSNVLDIGHGEDGMRYTVRVDPVAWAKFAKVGGGGMREDMGDEDMDGDTMDAAGMGETARRP